MAGETPFTATLEACKPGRGRVVTAVLDKFGTLDTGDKEISIRLPSRLPDLVLPDWMPGPSPSEKAALTPDQQADRAKRMLEETGVEQAELEARAHSFSERRVMERFYPSSSSLRGLDAASQPHPQDGSGPVDRALRQRPRRGGGDFPLRHRERGLVCGRCAGLSRGVLEAL